ncbi:MAG: lytic transglycosylase F [Pseudodesulfovibrio sp.]
MARIRPLTFVLLILTLALARSAGADSLARVTTQWTGDLPEMLEQHRPLRVLVTYNRTNFFLDKGAMRGMEYDLMTAYRKHLELARKEQVRMVFVAVPFDEMLPALLDGRGDIAAAGLTATAERKRQVAFSAPFRTGVDEVVVGSPKARPIARIEDLAGRTVHVMRGASYVAHLRAVSDGLRGRGMKPVKIAEADPQLVTEDLLRMASAGMIEYAAAESHLAELWKEALPNLRIFSGVPVHTGGELAWAVRPDAKALQQSLSAFAATVRQGTLLGNMLFKRYFVNTGWVTNPHDPVARKALDNMATVFIKYAEKYDFDWLKLAALGFQESRLNMDSKSNAGAVGVMQIKPSTASDPSIAIPDVHTLDGNIHAGTKYLRFLSDTYFQDVREEARVDFALAAYNAGPNRVRSLREAARSMGLDPDRWFGNVEWAAYRDIGRETPTYVANVQMYFAAYKSIRDAFGRKDQNP